MKKLATLVLAFAATLTLAFAGETTVKNTYSHQYDYTGFKALAVSNAFHVELTFADTWSVEVTVPDFIKPYLKVTCIANKVRIGLDKLPRDVQRKLEDLKNPLQAKVTAPYLHTLSMSGASKLIATCPQTLEDESFYVEMSGASSIESLEASGTGTLSIDISGASKLEMKADFNLTDIDLSGASKLDLTGSSGKMNIDLSGASNARINGDALVGIVEMSGSSKMTWDGKTGSLRIGQSGASKFESNGETANAEVELAGACKCRLIVTETLDYQLSGASTLRVKDLGAKMSGEQSRGSKIDFER